MQIAMAVARLDDCQMLFGEIFKREQECRQRLIASGWPSMKERSICAYDDV